MRFQICINYNQPPFSDSDCDVADHNNAVQVLKHSLLLNAVVRSYARVTKQM